MPNFKLTFGVSTPTSEYKMYRIFETESENLARDEALQIEWELCHVDAKVLFEKVETISSSTQNISRRQRVKSLTSKQAEQLSDLQEKLQSAKEKVEIAIADFNANVSELWNDLVLESLNDYNKLVEQAKEFVKDRREQMESCYEEGSEKWQQSERGEAFLEWINEWEEAQAELEEIDLTMPVKVDTPDFAAVEAIDALSTEPSL